MIKTLIFWYWRKYKFQVHPQEMYEVLVKIKKSYTMNMFGMPPSWEHRKYVIAAEYALGQKDMEQIAKEHDVTRERVRQIINKICRDCRNGLYETKS